MAHVSGLVHLRPARAGLLVAPEDGAAFVRAVELASSAWGGKYFPIVAPANAREGLRFLEALSVDFLYPVDDPPSKEFAQTVGFQWRGGDGWGPFNEYEGRLLTRLQDPMWLLPQAPRHLRTLAVWADDDPLSTIFAAWFGRYGQTGLERSLEREFLEGAKRVEIASTEPLPELAGMVTPIQLTGIDVQYSGDSESATVVVFEPDDKAAPFVLWNLQACGANVFPWPLGHEPVFTACFESWVKDILSSQQLGTYQSGTQGGHYLGIINLTGDESIPQAVRSIADSQQVAALPQIVHPPGGWHDVHPMATEFRSSFTTEISSQDWSIRVSVPRIEPIGGWRGHRSGIIALDVTVHDETGRPDLTIAMPRIRKLSSLLQHYLNVPEPFHRPNGNGRTLGIDIASSEVGITFVRSLDIFSELLAPDWRCSQSDNGKLTTRLVEMMGGSSSPAANQPSMREILTQVGQSPRGKPLAALIQTARQSQGSWPGLLSSPEANSRYPSQVPKSLIGRKILKPVLPVKCPVCSSETIFRPEDLSTVVECEFCSEAFPLGSALAQQTRNDWLYRLTGNVSPKRMAEALPIMAALTILSDYRRLAATSLPHVVGLELTSGRDWSCELDIAVFVEDGGPSIAVIGEVKSVRDPIDECDTENLIRVQDRFRLMNIECIIVGATLRENFDPDEVNTLRKLADRAPSKVHRQGESGAVLPIVLTRRDLSVPYFDKDHPARWIQPGAGLYGLALESCRRNLGLTDVRPKWTGSEWSWEPVWGTVDS